MFSLPLETQGLVEHLPYPTYILLDPFQTLTTLLGHSSRLSLRGWSSSSSMAAHWLLDSEQSSLRLTHSLWFSEHHHHLQASWQFLQIGAPVLDILAELQLDTIQSDSIRANCSSTLHHHYQGSQIVHCCNTDLRSHVTVWLTCAVFVEGNCTKMASKNWVHCLGWILWYRHCYRLSVVRLYAWHLRSWDFTLVGLCEAWNEHCVKSWLKCLRTSH